MKPNYMAVVVAAVVYWLLGAVWYGFLFSKLGVHVVRSARRIVLHLPTSTPFLDAWRHIALALGSRTG